ncbi:MAG TPA: phosphotransferase, partial [Myxococcaceae bacterium]|nr:phosphotransferase [Myxococcaceae bacterium]
MNLEAALRDQVARATGRPQHGAPVRSLKGDASNRSYLRVGTWPDSLVVMVMPAQARASEEAAGSAVPEELPFLDVHRYLARLGIRVPAILRHDEAAGMIVLEDLGDVTLEKALAARPPEELYPAAVDLLAGLRAAAEAAPAPESIAYRRAFDEELYLWELDHFREWGLEAWSGKTPTASERQDLEASFRAIAGRLAAAPRGFTHRDYQSRNLMVKD